MHHERCACGAGKKNVAHCPAIQNRYKKPWQDHMLNRADRYLTKAAEPATKGQDADVPPPATVRSRVRDDEVGGVESGEVFESSWTAF